MSSPCPQELPRADKHYCKHVSITIRGHEIGRAGCTLKHYTSSSSPGLYKHGRVTHLFLKILRFRCHPHFYFKQMLNLQICTIYSYSTNIATKFYLNTINTNTDGVFQALSLNDGIVLLTSHLAFSFF